MRWRALLAVGSLLVTSACGSESADDVGAGAAGAGGSAGSSVGGATSGGGAGSGGAGQDVVCGTPDEIEIPPYDEVTGCTTFLGSIHLPDIGAPEQLDALREIVRVEGSLTFFRNHGLVDCQPLSKLQYVGGLFSIRFNGSSKAFALTGLEALTDVGSLEINDNSDLSSLAGLDGLETVRGDVTIRSNPLLPSAEVDALLARLSIAGTVSVSENGP